MADQEGVERQKGKHPPHQPLHPSSSPQTNIFPLPGLLSGVLDPVGNVAGKALSPVGATVGAVTQPVTNTVGGVTKPVLDPVTGSIEDKNKNAKDDDKIGGKEQTGQNPLGL